MVVTCNLLLELKAHFLGSKLDICIIIVSFLKAMCYVTLIRLVVLENKYMCRCHAKSCKLVNIFLKRVAVCITLVQRPGVNLLFGGKSMLVNSYDQVK